MKKFGAAALLAAVILGAGTASPAAATVSAAQSGSIMQPYAGNWPGPF